MRIQTLSVVCGTAACDAQCPFCVSKMTYESKSPSPRSLDARNLRVAMRLAERAGVTTAMLTGKGEPTLWPDTVLLYLGALKSHFPLLELQTNGLGIGVGRISEETLRVWYRQGLTTVCLSVVHYDDHFNQQVYTPKGEYPPLALTIERLHHVGLSVRLSCVMNARMIDSWEQVQRMAQFAREHGVAQLTLVPVNAPTNSKQTEVLEWARAHRVDPSAVSQIYAAMMAEGTPLLELAHGATVFDYQGQNVCLSNCLGDLRYDDRSLIRNLIYTPDGHLRYSWEHKGAILL